MNKKVFYKILITILMVIGFLIVMQLETNAASLSISTSKSSVSPGEKFSVTVSVSGGAGYVNLSASNGTLSDTTMELMLKSSATVTCTAGSSGTVSISASGTIADYTTEREETKNASASVSIASSSSGGSSTSGGNTGTSISGGNTSNTASNNAKLSNLGITPNDFSGFKSGTTTYNATVPNNVTSVQVYAKVQASGAKYSVSGPYNNLQVGTNKITVTVTAPDGKTTNTYTIYVARQASKDEEVTPNVIDENNANTDNSEQPGTEEPEENQEQEALGLLSISIDEGYEIYLEPEFKTDVYEYTINLEEDLSEIPLTAIANRENAIIEITGNEDLQDGENIITITVTDEETGEKVEYKITVKKGMVVQEETEQEGDKNLEERKWLIIAVATGAVAVVIIIIVSCVIIRRRKKFESEFGVDYDEEDYDENYEQYYNQVNEKESTYESDSIEEKDFDNKYENPVDEKPKLDDVFGKSYVEEYEEEKPKNRRRGKGKHF